MSLSGYTCIRFVFCGINIAFWISGCGLLGVGLWLHIAYAGYTNLLPHYTLLSIESLAITLGTIILISSFIACCGSWFQNRFMLITYIFVVIGIFISELVLGSMAFTFRKQLQHTFNKELQYGLTHHFNVTAKGENSLTDIWDEIQTQFQCCGVQSYIDWYMIDAWPSETWVPDSCCIPEEFQNGCGKRQAVKVYSQGCYSKIHNFFLRRMDIIGTFGIVIAFIQIYGLISSIILFWIVLQKKTTRTYKSYYRNRDID